MKTSLHIFLLVVFPMLFAASSPAAQTLFLVNPTSEPACIAAETSAAELGDLPDGAWRAADGPSPVQIDIFDGTAYLLTDQPAMSILPVTLPPQALADDQKMTVTTDGDALRITTSRLVYAWPGDGSLHLENQQGTRTVRMPGQPRLLYRGVNVVILAVGEARVEVHRSGAACIKGLRGLTFETNGSATAFESRRENYGVVGPPTGQPLRFGEDWWRIDGPAGQPGIAIFPGAGCVLTASRDGVTVQGEAAEFWLAPAASDDQARALRTATLGLVVLRAQGDRFTGRIQTADEAIAIEVFDRNANTAPDFQQDLWLIGPPGEGKKRVLLDFGTADDGNTARLAIHHGQAGSAAVGDRPVAVVEDWNGDGRFWQGSLIFGGYLSADRMSQRPGQWSTCWDLDGDGMAEVFDMGGGGYLFNFLKQTISPWGIEIDPVQANAQPRRHAGYDMQRAGSMFKKSDDAGRTWQGARLPFEEHFYVRFEPGDLPEMFPEGASLFYYTLEGKVGRLTMGRMGHDNALRAWEIELKPRYAQDAASEWQIVQWTDAAGHELKLLSPSLPRQWDGQRLGPRQFLRGWYEVVQQRDALVGLQAVFAPPGSPNGSSEGMYGGALSTGERIEYDPDGASFVLYYSPLMGGLHLKGAQVGSYAVPSGTPDFWLDIHRYYHREAHVGSPRFVGTEPRLRWQEGREIKRMEGPVFLSYHDRRHRGHFDTYLYDLDNDGVYDRRLEYDADAGVLMLNDDRFVTAWAEGLTFDEVEYLPENYAKVAGLYRRGFGQAPLVARAQIGSGGIPVILETQPVYRERQPAFFVSLDKRWQVRVAVDRYHAADDRASWRDFGPDGLSRVGSMFVLNGLMQTQLDQPWTDQSLDGVSVLLVSDLERVPDDAELAALRRWIERGGRLVLACAEDPAQRLRFDALGEILGFRLGSDLIERRTAPYRIASLGPINDPKTRGAPERRPGLWNAIAHFSSSEPALLEGFDYLSFVGYAVAEMDQAYQPLLRYEDQTLIAAASLGEGQVIISGANLWTNRYIWHHEFYEYGTHNDRLIERIVASLASDLPVPQIRAIEVMPRKNIIKLAGRGGVVRYARRYEPRASGLAHIESFNSNNIPIGQPTAPADVLVNGKAVQPVERGVLVEVEVPPGAVTIEINFTAAEASAGDEAQ